MKTIIKLWAAGISSVVGFSACIAFFVLKNYPSGVLGLISGTTDGLTCFLHYQQWKGTLRSWYDPSDLRKICRIGILVATVGLLSLGYFTTIQIMLKLRGFLISGYLPLSLMTYCFMRICENEDYFFTAMMPASESAVISIVWSIIALRSGIFMMYHTIKYQEEEETGLVEQIEDGD